MKLRKKSQQQEKKVAKELKGKVTPASGALDCAKGDVRSDLFLVECKTTSKGFYPLSINTWEKICKEALRDGLRTPVMCIDLKDGACRLAVVNLLDFYEQCPHTFDFFGETITVVAKSFRVSHKCVVKWSSINHKSFDLLILDWNTFITDLVPAFKECM